MQSPSPEQVEVLLADGSIATIRPFVAADAPALRALHDKGSDSSIRKRFFTLDRKSADRYVDRLVSEEGGPGCALVVETGGSVVAMATAEPITADNFEVAFFVADAMQGKGLGTLLLEHLAARCRRTGVRFFTAEVLIDNVQMLRVFRDAGFDMEQEHAAGLVELRMSTEACERAVAAADAREREAESRSLAPLLSPRAVAVVGAGRSRGKVGREVLENLRAGGFTGPMYAVHPVAEDIDGVPAFASLAQTPEHVDLAIVAVPADKVLDAVDDAGAAGVGAAVVLSSQFAEAGPEGVELQRELVRHARRHGMRLVGPNCLGVWLHTAHGLVNATFAALHPPVGGLAVAAQSGGVGISLLDTATDTGLGIAAFVSLGNKADVSGNDLIAAWTDDPGVKAAALYLESFGNPAKFARLARRFAERKPLLAMVGGSSTGGRRGGASHTAAAAAPAVAVQALFSHAGVIAVSSLEELSDTARLLLSQPLPQGNRIGVIGNAGGLAILTADAAQRDGLALPELSPDLQARLTDAAPGAAGVANPIDLGAAASPRMFQRSLEEVAGSGEVDAVVVMFTATRVSDTTGVLAAIERAAAASPHFPVVAVLHGLAEPPTTVGAGQVPVYRAAERATKALVHAARYAGWRATPAEAAPRVDEQVVSEAAGLVTGWLPHDGARWLAPSEVRALLSLYGIEAPMGTTVRTAREAARAAEQIGFPVVVKAADPAVVHKTERSLVEVGLLSGSAVIRAARRISHLLGEANSPVLIQRQITRGVEVALGVVQEPSFGPLVMVAAGGVATDVWADRAFLLPPVSRSDAARAVASLRILPLLQGFRGAPTCDIEALVDLIVKVGSLARDVPQVAELDLNPVIVTPDGAFCVDAALRLSAPRATVDGGIPRRLRQPV